MPAGFQLQMKRIWSTALLEAYPSTHIHYKTWERNTFSSFILQLGSGPAQAPSMLTASHCSALLFSPSPQKAAWRTNPQRHKDATTGTERSLYLFMELNNPYYLINRSLTILSSFSLSAALHPTRLVLTGLFKDILRPKLSL